MAGYGAVAGAYYASAESERASAETKVHALMASTNSLGGQIRQEIANADALREAATKAQEEAKSANSALSKLEKAVVDARAHKAKAAEKASAANERRDTAVRKVAAMEEDLHQKQAQMKRAYDQLDAASAKAKAATDALAGLPWEHPLLK